MEIILVGLSEYNFSPYVLLCKLAEFFYLLFKLLAFGRLPSGIIEDMEIAFCCELPSRVTLADFQTTKKLANPHKY